MIYVEQPPASDLEMLIIAIKADDWFATQSGPREVSIVSRQTQQVLHKISPPAEWKRWAWNLLPDGTGIYLVRR